MMALLNPKICHRCGRGEEEGTGWNVKVLHRDGSGRLYTHDECPERVCKKGIHDTIGVGVRICSRDGKAETSEGWLCGIHLAGYRRRKKSEAKWKAEADRSGNNRARANHAVDILKELGIESAADYSMLSSRYTGKVVIDAQDLLKLAGIAVRLQEVE